MQVQKPGQLGKYFQVEDAIKTNVLVKKMGFVK